MAIGSPQWMYSSGSDYELEQSLKFEDSRVPHLSTTFASAGNRKTYTFSCWIKRSVDTGGQIFVGENTSTPSNSDYLQFQSNNKLRFFQNGASSTYAYLQTNQVFRDSSAWYNIVLAVDTTQSTASNRVKIYINGIQITSFATETYPNQHTESYINSNVPHGIGAQSAASSLSSSMDGYLGEVNFIDGQALTPTDFGETGDYGEWKPIEYSGTYGTNGFYLPFNTTQGIIAATGGTITTDGDYKIHTFTSSGTFTPTTVPTSAAYVQYLVVAGGGAAGRGYHWGGGGGAGGMREGYLEVSAQGYSITVGAGGVFGTNGGQGGNSIFSSITSTGGGAGQSGHEQGGQTATTGGSGGGAVGTGAAGIAGQGFAGGTGTGGLNPHGGGGGGASEAGSTDAIMDGGDGRESSISGSSVVYAGGGAGRREDQANGTGGTGGGGSAANGTDGLGGGGGSASGNTNGGSGVVIIKYRYQ